MGRWDTTATKQMKKILLLLIVLTMAPIGSQSTITAEPLICGILNPPEVTGGKSEDCVYGKWYVFAYFRNTTRRSVRVTWKLYKGEVVIDSGKVTVPAGDTFKSKYIEMTVHSNAYFVDWSYQVL